MPPPESAADETNRSCDDPNQKPYLTKLRPDPCTVPQILERQGLVSTLAARPGRTEPQLDQCVTHGTPLPCVQLTFQQALFHQSVREEMLPAPIGLGRKPLP